MDSNSKRRMQWRQEEMERRRTDRARQRSEIMLQRTQAAQTRYMDRMAQRAQANGASGSAAGAIAYGESRGEYADRRQGYMNAQSQRDLAASQGYAARTGADAQAKDAEANYMGVQQRPDLQKAQIAGELEGQRIANQGSLAVAQQQGENQVRVGQLGVSAAREEAQATRDAANAQIAMQLKMQQDSPFVTDQGVVRRQSDGSYTMDAFPDPAEAKQKAIDESYKRGNWIQDTTNYLFGHGF